LFRLLDFSATPEWIFLENVPFMLHLDRGAAMEFLVAEFEKRGYAWAYRVVDSRAFGLPQRRRRVLLLASKSKDPRGLLLNEDSGKPPEQKRCDAFGFYWTEGNTGLGWAQNAIPTLKGGSSLGIPSPPAIWIRSKGIFLPDIRDAERLQGFKPGWTASSASVNGRAGIRWKLLGNAVCVPVAEWIGGRICLEEPYVKQEDRRLTGQDPWPACAWGKRGRKFAVDRSAWPANKRRIGLVQFLKYPLVPLTANATEGFFNRARASRLKFHEEFLGGVSAHLEDMLSRSGGGGRSHEKER
jgi:DNA (cytosine-5)-methyltransferase 1